MVKSDLLLDHWMPDYEVAARYERVIDAPLARVWQACLDSRPDQNFVIRILFAIRKFSFSRGPSQPLQQRLSRSGFLLLEQRAGEEIVRGVAGQFWKPSGGVVRLESPDAWRNFAEDGSARSAMCMRVRAQGAAQTRLFTETRVQTFGQRAHRSFRRYWWLIGPFSGLIRILWLREIDRLARQGGSSA
jgi:hypothetical protein